MGVWKSNGKAGRATCPGRSKARGARVPRWRRGYQRGSGTLRRGGPRVSSATRITALPRSFSSADRVPVHAVRFCDLLRAVMVLFRSPGHGCRRSYRETLIHPALPCLHRYPPQLCSVACTLPSSTGRFKSRGAKDVQTFCFQDTRNRRSFSCGGKLLIKIEIRSGNLATVKYENLFNSLCTRLYKAVQLTGRSSRVSITRLLFLILFRQFPKFRSLVNNLQPRAVF